MRIDKVTEFLHRTMMVALVLMSVTAVFLLAPRVIATGEALAAPTCEAGSHQVAGQCMPDPAPVAQQDAAPVASSLDYSTESVLIVEGQNPDTTPVVEVTFPSGAQIWIPEEDPNGGHVTPMWLDNSPLYSGGWLLQIDDVAGTVQWIDVQERLTLTDDESTDQGTDQYGAGAGAVCGTDAQCAAWSEAHGEEPSGYAADKGNGVQTVAYAMHSKRHSGGWTIAEDGSLVPQSYYDHVTTTGATQARCDYLGKRRVTDPVYGHRCV